MDLFLIKHKLKNDFPLVREVTRAHPKRAAVMVMLYPKDNTTYVLMTRRATHLKYHAGEMSFPGGMFEEGKENDLLATALRETQEELAIEIEQTIMTNSSISLKFLKSNIDLALKNRSNLHYRW